MCDCCTHFCIACGAFSEVGDISRLRIVHLKRVHNFSDEEVSMYNDEMFKEYSKEYTQERSKRISMGVYDE